MCDGGGSVKAPNPMKESQAQIDMMRAQYRLDQRAAEAAAARAAEQEAAEREQWQTDLGGARGAAQQAINQQFRSEGLRPDDYERQIMSALDLEQSGKAFGTSPAFSTDLGENILSDIRGDKVRSLNDRINTFAPEGFENKAFASTADDAILDAILNEQFGAASDAIMRAQARGNLNDAGYRYAMDNLGTQKQAASSRLQDMGGGVLEGYRGQLGDIAERARTGASSWDFGDTFTPQTYRRELGTRERELGGRLEGDIRNAVGGEQFFNIDDLISKGITGQGAINTGAGAQGGNALMAALSSRRKEEQQRRGLGTQGSF